MRDTARRISSALLPLVLGGCVLAEVAAPPPHRNLTWRERAEECYRAVRDREVVIYQDGSRRGGLVGRSACEQFVEDMELVEARRAAASTYQQRELNPFVGFPPSSAAPGTPAPTASVPASTAPAPGTPAPGFGEAAPAPHQVPGPFPGFTPYRFERATPAPAEMSREEWLKRYPHLR